MLAVFTLSVLTTLTNPSHILAAIATKPSEAIGQITPPPGTENYMKNTGNENQLLPFISTLLTIGALVAGIWVLVNIFLAGYSALTSQGDSGAMGKIRTSITNSVIGLALIVLAYTFAALAGTIIFGDATLFIKPKF